MYFCELSEMNENFYELILFELSDNELNTNTNSITVKTMAQCEQLFFKILSIKF